MAGARFNFHLSCDLDLQVGSVALVAACTPRA